MILVLTIYFIFNSSEDFMNTKNISWDKVSFKMAEIMKNLVFLC